MQRILLFLLVLCVSLRAAEASIWLDKDWQPTELKKIGRAHV